MMIVPLIRNGLVDHHHCTTLLPLKGKKILDVGCGGGLLTEPLAKLGAEVTGIDASRELVEMAQAHSSNNEKLINNIPKYYCTTIEEHAQEYKEEYDGVVCSEIIEHVTNKELFIQSCVDTLKVNGRIFFTTPNRTRLSHLGVIFLAENIFKMVPKGTHQIEKFVTPNELKFLLERNKCFVELTHGVMYNPITNRWSWSNTQAFAFALQAVKTTH
ncbi:methyltransferase domain-containing protein [Phthorimaea operculella]|nr:methyltransferase domain-containing protein [Phthorimaea operculella]